MHAEWKRSFLQHRNADYKWRFNGREENTADVFLFQTWLVRRRRLLRRLLLLWTRAEFWNDECQSEHPLIVFLRIRKLNVVLPLIQNVQLQFSSCFSFLFICLRGAAHINEHVNRNMSDLAKGWFLSAGFRKWRCIGKNNLKVAKMSKTM